MTFSSSWSVGRLLLQNLLFFWAAWEFQI
jgi:hypothetical protein